MIININTILHKKTETINRKERMLQLKINHIIDNAEVEKLTISNELIIELSKYLNYENPEDFLEVLSLRNTTMTELLLLFKSKDIQRLLFELDNDDLDIPF